MTASRYVGRLAPSPTGALHLGNARTFMIAWLRARSQGGRVIFRMEDLDHPRDKPGAAGQAVEDLKWLGFDWDAEYVQSERKAIYRDALDFLHERGLVYPCICTRKDVEQAQSAPHAGEQLYYPGTCRGRFPDWQSACAAAKGRTPCWRFHVARPSSVWPVESQFSPSQGEDALATRPSGCSVQVSFTDAFAGAYAADVAATLGDFPLARDEGGAGYTLACVVDDLLMGVTEVVRGDDLLAATPAQILLARALRPWLATGGACADATARDLPGYCHVPLVVGRDGKRLAKRHGDTRLATFRAAGKRPEEILGVLAASCGWAKEGEKVALTDLLARFDLATIPHRPFMI